MRFFYDTEFLEKDGRIFPISIGIVSDEPNSMGDFAYYAALQDANWEEIIKDEWIRENVIPNLGESATLKPRRQVGAELMAFVASFGGTSEDNELWAYYAAYDHVVLSQIYGRMIDIPEPVPMHTNDIMTIANVLGLPDPKLDTSSHNALIDAEQVCDAYRNLTAKSRKGQDK
ncbi:MAG: 3'-5' exoribonuclease [Enterococcus faecalis]|nr:3'-5' exoribonuclease [Enterococcus faecalis]